MITTQLFIMMAIFLVVITLFLMLLILFITNNKITKRINDIEKRILDATTMCEIIKIWDDYEKLCKDSLYKVYGTRLNHIKDMILTKLDSLRNSTNKHL